MATMNRIPEVTVKYEVIVLKCFLWSIFRNISQLARPTGAVIMKLTESSILVTSTFQYQRNYDNHNDVLKNLLVDCVRSSQENRQLRIKT